MKTIRYAICSALAVLGLAATHCSSTPAPSPPAESAASIVTGPAPACTSPVCTAQFRECKHTDSVETVCGHCIANYAPNATGACEPVKACADACPHQGCDATSGAAVCLASCDAGYVLDAATGKCRAPSTCVQVQAQCTGGQTCQEAPDGGATGAAADAQCRCPDGQGWDPATHQCTSCGTDGAPECSAVPGQTSGRVVFGAGACMCELPDNYFVPLGGDPKPCDADGDGWVNEDAQRVIEELPADAAERALFRCHVRRVSQLVLQGDDGTKAAPIDLTPNTGDTSRNIPAGLPLYENEALEGAVIGDSVYRGAMVNSMTKACVVEAGDFNANKVPDVGEAPQTSLADLRAARPMSDRLLGYYGTYERYSYFLELANAWYEEAALSPGAAPVGVYHVTERRRIDGTGIGVAMTDTDPADSSDYWQTCPRKPDSLAVNNPNVTLLPGYDFSDKTTPAGFAVMGHHSQFKCGLIVSPTRYGCSGSGGVCTTNELKAPELVALTQPSETSWTLWRAKSDNALAPYSNWSLKSCAGTGAATGPAASVSPTNPWSPLVSCKEGFGGGPVAVDQVKWIVVDGMESADKPYERGCANLCKGDEFGGCLKGVSLCRTNETPGYPTCGCPPTYKGNGSTEACHCDPGFRENNDSNNPQCVDRNECTDGSAQCGANTTCTDHTPSSAAPNDFYACACLPNYEGNPTTGCVPYNNCAHQLSSARCDYVSYCAPNAPGSSTCLPCSHGYNSNGWTCDASKDICKACPANGHCNSNWNGWACACNSGYHFDATGACVK